MATSATELDAERFLYEFLPSPDTLTSMRESSFNHFLGLRNADDLASDDLSELFVSQASSILVTSGLINIPGCCYQ